MRHFHRDAGALRCLVFCALVSGVLSIWAFAMQRAGFPYEAYLRDSVVFDVPYAGAISNIGIALMSLTAALAAVTWISTRDTPFLLLAVFATMFALDDGLMWHEAIGDADKLLVATHGVLFTATYLSFRRILIWPLLFVVFCFAFSVGMDEAQWVIQIEWIPYYLLEDGAKFCGICLLFVFAFSEWAHSRRRTVSGTGPSV